MFIQSDSEYFLQTVKFGETAKAKELLNENRNLIFEHDSLFQTAFHLVAKRNDLKTLKMLVAYGKCVNTYDINRKTPLMLAVKFATMEFVTVLK